MEHAVDDTIMLHDTAYIDLAGMEHAVDDTIMLITVYNQPCASLLCARRGMRGVTVLT